MKETVFDEDGLYGYFVERGKAKLETIQGERDKLIEDGYPQKDVDLAMEICACVIGLLEETQAGVTDDIAIGLSFRNKRQRPSDCLGTVADEDVNGFGFYTLGMCRAVELKLEEAAVHGAEISRKARLLALAARHARAFFIKLKMVEIFDSTDYAYDVGQDLREILWSLDFLVPKFKADLEHKGKVELLGQEVDEMAIELLAAKSASLGTSPAAFAALVKMNAPDRKTAEKQPLALFL
jgi:hypothetical protein